MDKGTEAGKSRLLFEQHMRLQMAGYLGSFLSLFRLPQKPLSQNTFSRSMLSFMAYLNFLTGKPGGELCTLISSVCHLTGKQLGMPRQPQKGVHGQ